MTQYRAKVDAPTSDGIYFARRNGYLKYINNVHTCFSLQNLPIVPVLVEFGRVYELMDEIPNKIEQFDWFGPVDPVREG